MRILFTTQPALGHLHPLVPLARAAALAGHSVLFASAAAFVPAVRAAGFECIPAGVDWLESEAERFFPELQRLPPGPEANQWWVSEIFGAATATEMARDLVAHFQSAGAPDLVVRDPLEFGGCVAAEHRGIPHASAGASVFVSPRDWRTMLAAPLGALRQAHGLPPDPGLAMIYRYLDLSGVPPQLLMRGEYVPPVTHFVRPEPFDRSGGDEAPAWLAAPRGRALVCASLGTVYNRTPGLFELIVAALRDEPIELAVLVGHNYDRAALGDQPGHIHVEAYVPQTVLFPSCELVITHGGLNSVIAALCHGLPMVVLPIGADQLANARRCEALGVASVVEPAGRSAAAVRSAARQVLGDARYRRNAQRMQGEIARLPGLEHGVALLERLAAQRWPLPRRGWRAQLAARLFS